MLRSAFLSDGHCGTSEQLRAQDQYDSDKHNDNRAQQPVGRCRRVKGRSRLLEVLEHQEALRMIGVVDHRDCNRGGGQATKVCIAEERTDAFSFQGNTEAFGQR